MSTIEEIQDELIMQSSLPDGEVVSTMLRELLEIKQLSAPVKEAYNFGQFADDFDQPLAKPIRSSIRKLCDAL